MGFIGRMLKLNEGEVKGKESMEFEIGEGLSKTVEVLPGPRISTLEAIKRGEEIKVVSPYRFIGRMAQPLQTISPYGIAQEIVRKEITPVGKQIKVPFMQREITVPADTVGELTKLIVELPEKVYQSLKPSYTEEIKKTGKIPEKKAIYNVITYQEELQNLIDKGYSPLTAFILVGAGTIIDTAILGDILRPIASQIMKIPVSAKTIQSLTWNDLSNITRGKILSAEKMAAFNKASQEGIDWIKLLKERGRIESIIKEGKTLGQWTNEQIQTVRASQADRKSVV